MRRHPRPRKTVDIKQRQLCSQVEQAIDLAFGASEDWMLQGCWVESVRPAPPQARLRIRVRTDEDIEYRWLADRLERATAWLREQVAAFISRKRTPILVLELVPPIDEE